VLHAKTVVFLIEKRQLIVYLSEFSLQRWRKSLIYANVFAIYRAFGAILVRHLASTKRLVE
jgi:hypothetical protein